MTRDHDLRNREARARLLDVIARFRADDWRRPLEDGWTPAALLGHLAFWDHFVLARWRQFERLGRFVELPDEQLELTNGAALPLWLALSGAQAAELATAAAAAADRAIEALPSQAVDAALATNRPTMVDRSLHRREHLDALERDVLLDPARERE